MKLQTNEIPENSELTFDLCIVGGGPAGITIARELAKTNISVCLVESGGLEYDQETQDLYQSSKSSPIYPDTDYSRLRYFGGASNHWDGSCGPLSPIDFEKRDWVPNSGWPITYDELKPHYIKAQRYCELGEFNYSADHWENQTGYSKLPLNDGLIESRVAQSSPPTRFATKWGQSLFTEDNVSVILNGNVTDLISESKDTIVNTAIVRSLAGNQFRVRAKKFILAMGGIENARMLLQWTSNKDTALPITSRSIGRYFMDHPIIEAAYFFPFDPSREERFYNHWSAIGVEGYGYLNFSEAALKTYQLTNFRMPLKPVDNFQASLAIASTHSMKKSIANGMFPNHFWKHIRNIASDLDMVAEGVARKKYSRRIFDHADEHAGFVFDAMMEQTPSKDNRVELSSEKDPLGIAKVSIKWQVSDDDKERAWRAFSILGKEIAAARLGRVRLIKEMKNQVWDDQMGFGHHHMGTTRMASSPFHGVVDSKNKVFGLNNLYVAGSSVFPTGGHVPPTLTIVALSVRLAQALKEEFHQ